MTRVPVRKRPEWQDAKTTLREMLAEAARSRATVTYADVALRVFGGTVPARSRLIMDLLAEVDEEVEREEGIVIATLVVRRDSGLPGAGYFTFLATRFGADVSDPATAWAQYAQAVWDHFATEDGGARAS